MKAKLLKGYFIDESTSLVAGTEIEVVTGYCTCNGYDYECDINGRRVIISSEYLQVTDLTPHIDWEQIRIQAAIAAMQGVLSNPAFCNISTNKELPIKIAIYSADALIKELKKNRNSHGKRKHIH